MTTDDLQRRAVAWHKEKWPASLPYRQALKAMAELGEVAEELLAEPGNRPEAAVTEYVVNEAADVVITLLVLTGRYSREDLLAAVDRKLTLLTTPGAHRHSLTAKSWPHYMEAVRGAG